MKNKLGAYFWIALTIFSLVGQIAWVVENMYFNVFIYKMFSALPKDISLMVTASAVTATLTTIFMGALSDKIGKRKLFICLGYIMWGVSIFAFVLLRTDIIYKTFALTSSAAAVGVSLAIALDCVMTFFGSTANDAAFNAWITDSTDSSIRGTAEGINAMMPLVSILVVFGGFMFFNLDNPKSWSIIFTIIGILVILIGFIGFFIIKEPEIKPSKENYFKSIVYGFKPDTVKNNIRLYISLAAFTIFNISIQIFMPYLIIYYEVSLGIKNYVLIMAPAVIIAVAVTAFWGKIYDKKGFNFSALIAICSLALGYIILFFTKQIVPVFIGSLFMMSGYLAGMAVFGAVIRDNTPKGKSGSLQGIRIFSQVLLPGVIGPFIGKKILDNAEIITNNDGTISFIPNENIFLAAAVVLVLIFPFLIFIANMKKPRLVSLHTDFEKKIENTDIPLSQYPRPTLKRDSYLCLNGKWNFKIISKQNISYSGEIIVPFPPESKISKVCRSIGKNDTLVYERDFILEEQFLNDKLLFHIGACDQYASVYINNKLVGDNIGGYLHFSFDITDYVTLGQNNVRIEAKDPLNLDLPYGKQAAKRGGMWYTKISGIWQTVWLESVCENYVKSIRCETDTNGVTLYVEGGESEKTLYLDQKEYSFTGDSFRVDIKSPKLWTPENPYLYEFTLTSGKDKINSYFGLRTVEIKEINKKSYICLNGKPMFFHGLLDQGYFSDGIFIPASYDGFKNDILQMKKCGFNTLRKHIKLEPEIFYYYCDKYGMIVFQDMINSGKYNFFVDTALPTVFLKKGITHFASKNRRQEFIKTCKGIIDTLYNHPSVVYYTIFNEGWGQFSANEMYETIKAFDNTRIYDTTSGWFKCKNTDVESDHIYFKPVKLKLKKGKPMVLSEFGGYSCRIEEHTFNLDKNYGYKVFGKSQDFENALVKLYEKQIIPMIEKGLCVTILTQLSDVEDETNGLLTYDRKVLKVDNNVMNKLSKKIIKSFSANGEENEN